MGMIIELAGAEEAEKEREQNKTRCPIMNPGERNGQTFVRAPDARTREAWLVEARDRLGPLFEERAIALPKARLSVGFPYRRLDGNGRNQAIGQCWARRASKDGTSEVFISPTLDEELSVLEVLCHELVHCVDDCVHGHRGPFRKMALADRP